MYCSKHDDGKLVTTAVLTSQQHQQQGTQCSNMHLGQFGKTMPSMRASYAWAGSRAMHTTSVLVPGALHMM
jgi:hypothetical protein